MSFSAQVGRSAVWAVIGQASTAVLSVVNFAVVGRFVDPSEYGIFLLAMMVLTATQWLALNAYKEPLVQTPEVNERQLDAVFSFSLLVGTLLALVMGAAALYVNYVKHAHVLALCIVILAGKLWFDTVLSVPAALRIRKLEFAFVARVSIASNVVATVINISMLVAGFGLVSLVCSLAVASLLTACAYFYSGQRRYRWCWDTQQLRVLRGYSPHVILWQAIEAVNQTVDRYLIAARLSLSDLGLYGFGKRLNDVIIEVLVGATSSVSLPAFSQLQQDPARLQAAFLKAVRIVTLMVLPVIAALWATADDFVPLLFGAKWEGAIVVYRWFLLLGVIQTIGILQGGLLRSMWKPGTWTRYMLAQSAANVVVLSVVAGYGIEVLAAAIVIRSYVLWSWIVVQTCRALQMKVRFYVVQLMKPVSIAVIAALAGVGVHRLLSAQMDLHVVLRLLACGSVVLVVFALFAFAFLRPAVTEIVTLVRSMLAKRIGSSP
jgi:teichuronic acid exporter